VGVHFLFIFKVTSILYGETHLNFFSTLIKNFATLLQRYEILVYICVRMVNKNLTKEETCTLKNELVQGSAAKKLSENALFKKRSINWDALGIATSIACAIHCALLPLFLTSLPLFGIEIIENKAFENFMIALAFGIGFYSLHHGWKKHHRQKLPLVLFSLGILSLVAKQFWHERQLLFLIPAVVFIVTAHVLNYHFCRTKTACKKVF
jgi:putative Mn2+ efflux pump MntP